MKDYSWVIVASVFALVAFLLFTISIGSTSSLIKRLRLNKLNILLNISLLVIGFGNIYFAVYLLQNVREQIELFTNL